ncbi:thermonuclease family protein [Pontibacter harenae]|uniref:thermonuclease family protein n=1 Tax=Pontibacter harenae TaxID=2894083 RepID=UPI001E3D61B0|nr:thermonuclease family protein [Pontibacter harenae]MCC9166921.1 thermonuclease family protein [Pontibacter harenae]
MRNIFIYLLFILTLFAGISCNQDKNRAREEFRERQAATRRESTVPEVAQETSEIETAPATPSEAEEERPTTTASDKVIGVKDGDTMELLQNGQSVTVRLYGVDAPEKNQDYGQRAKQFASDLVFGKEVQLIVHNKDRYGRTVGTIKLLDGRSLNEELVKNGFAWHYKAYSKDKNLENLEADARRFKRGLWQDPNPTPPWDFRKGKRDGTTTNEAPAATAEATVLPRNAKKTQVYICNSSGSTVYHTTKDCFVLNRCKAEVLALTEAAAIQEHGRRMDKACTPK